MLRCFISFLTVTLFCLKVSHSAVDSTLVNPSSGPSATAISLSESESIVLDAKLDDGIWSRALWLEGFTQKDPVEGEKAAEKTEVAFAFDDGALYFAARMWTPVTGTVESRLSARDDMGQTQSFFVSLDTYHDKRTAYTFGITAAGVQVDFYHPEDRELYQIMSWNPVWDVRTRINSDHWVVEARIPFSQLRFNSLDEQIWGLQMDRWTPERDAEDYWVMIPRAETGWSSRFGELHGIRGIKPSSRIELLPYIAADAYAPAHPDPEDPFVDDLNSNARFGGDLKMGLGSNLTLDATINPDFGQVEADPAEVNLSAFETFFSERRPFFLEGDVLLRGRGPRYYYSRRIGASPSIGLPDSVTHADYPRNTRILGAAKITGRLSSGLSIGALASLTDREFAETSNNNSTQNPRGRFLVEPRTRQGVLRLQQEFEPSGSLLGVSLTGLKRDLENNPNLIEAMNESAVSGGVDGLLRLDDGDYELSGFWGFSQIEGDSSAISDVQLRSTHYFQRPDEDHVHYDSGRTSLYGWTGALELEREGGEHLRWSTGAAAESPGFELNDMGRLGSADDIDSWFDVNWVENKGSGLFRRSNLGVDFNAGWNFGGVPTERGASVSFWGMLQNFWSMNGGYYHGFSAYSDHLSRGGITLATRGENNVWFSVNSAQLQNPNSVSWGGSTNWGAEGRLRLNSWFFTRLRPNQHWEIRFNPSWSHDIQPAQYIGRYESAAGERVLFAKLDYRETRISTRIRYTASPRLSLELYIEPFMASIRYTDPGRALGSGSDIIERYADLGDVQQSPEGLWTLPEPQEDGSPVLEVDRTNFEFSSWRSNFVLRWDWRPGSSCYFIWQQDRENFHELKSPDSTPDPFDALTTASDNLVAIKISYWFPVG